MAQTANPKWEESRGRCVSPWLAALEAELPGGAHEDVVEAKLPFGQLRVESTATTLWGWLALAKGGLALRLAYAPGRLELRSRPRNSVFGIYRLDASIGRVEVELTQPEKDLPLIRWKATLTPAMDLVVPYWPRDLIAVDPAGHPLKTRGMVYASQRGPKAPFVYASLTTPPAGTFLYMQDLTSLNDYCEATRTRPYDCVGGEWPELGFSLPVSKEHALAKGQPVVISDALLRLTPEVPQNHRAAARLYIELFADLYLHLQRPETHYHDWQQRAKETIRDLFAAPECTTNRRGLKYFNAYVGRETNPPESMVQMSVLMPMLDYATRRHIELPQTNQIAATLGSFFNPTVGSIVRYLPGEPLPEGAEEHQNHHTMDSWYMYHTLLNVGRLALKGDAEAKRLLVQSLPYAQKVAHRYKYRWPIFYDLYTLEPIKSVAASGYGETDVAGLYALLMLQAYDLTQDKSWLKEAETAAWMLNEYGFRLAYQFNSTVYSAVALARLWVMKQEQLFQELSLVCVANFLANTWMWQCTYGHGKAYPTFFGLPPLDNAPYIAVYEEQECLEAFASYLEILGRDAPPRGVDLLLSEYSKYLLDRGWYSYPQSLPKEIFAEKSHDGHLNLKLAIPIEDMGDGWYEVGAVGQEVYGAGAAPPFAAWAYHEVAEGQFLIFSEYLTGRFASTGNGRKGSVQFGVRGDPRLTAKLRFTPAKGKKLPRLTVRQGKDGKGKGEELPQKRNRHDVEVTVRGGLAVTVEWGGGRGG